MTPFLAATATAERALPWGWLIGALLLAAAGYVASCAWWPFTRCSRCEGSGKRSRSDGKVWRTCRSCKGAGKRLRAGRRLWNRFAAVRNASQ